MTGAVSSQIAARSPRLLAVVRGLEPPASRPPAQLRLEAAIGRDLAGRLVAALSANERRR